MLRRIAAVTAKANPSAMPSVRTGPARSGDGDRGSGCLILCSPRDERLRSGLLDPRGQPGELSGCLRLAPRHDRDEVAVADGLGGGLADERPGDVDVADEQVQVVQVAEQADASASGVVQTVSVQPFRLGPERAFGSRRSAPLGPTARRRRSDSTTT